MNYVFLEVKTLHSKDDKEIYILSVLDISNLIVQKIFVSQKQLDLLQGYNMFDNISDLIEIRYNQQKMCYQLALAN